MRRLLVFTVIGALGLAGCAPTAFVQASVPDPGQAVLGFQTGKDAVLGFSAGKLDAFDLVVKVSGEGLRVNAPSYCHVERRDILCTVPTLPAGKNFILPMKGSNLSAVATYKRGGGQSFTTEARR
ncbi:hypothetical protein [Deinococcus sp. Leaf326]|uniref:hypothetical protein n=1 Tax=Deinococcus sp. Leaf326 TaxID=1736338 RepID=UPI0006F4B6F6|nr:hypothetical protein [Deinococcus sp. Leaf326]KQR22710.1 hypothetical protein ASF71_05890 [Deinococcus sp. Leaf326]